MNDKETTNRVDDGYPAGLKHAAGWACVPAVLAGVAYGLTVGGGVAPGLPARAVASAFADGATPAVLDPAWTALAAALDGNAAALSWLSAACGVLCVWILSFVMTRVRYAVHDRHDADEGRREHQARVLSGLVAGLFLAFSVPTWVAATRSLPDMFHLLWLMLALLVFSEYQRAGGTWRLVLLGVAWGAGLAEFPTFWILLPFAAVMVVRAQLQRAEFSWRATLWAAAAVVAAGLAGYAWAGWRAGAIPILGLQGVSGFWSGLWCFLKQQGRWLFVATHGTGFLLSFSLTLLPWGILFLLRSKKPAWRHSAWVVALRLLVLAACMGALWGAPMTTWHFFGISYLMLTPAAILAGCLGYVAGDFWVTGQLREHRGAGVGQPLRSTLGIVGALLLPVVLAAGAWNWPVADARPGAVAVAAASDALDRLGGADTVIGDGALDDVMLLEARGREKDFFLVSAPMTPHAYYRKWLAETRFTDDRSRALLDLGFGPFLQDYLQRDGNASRTAMIGGGGLWADWGELVPDGLLVRFEGEQPAGDGLTALVESQKPFWKAAAADIGNLPAWAAKRRDRENPEMPFVRYVKMSASRQANNAAFLLLDEGREAEAEEILLLAREIAPDNPSVLLNLLTLANGRGETNSVYRAEWDEFMAGQRDDRVLWSLRDRFGYVHNAGMLIRQGMMWAVSGRPRQAEAELRRSRPGGPQGETGLALKAFLGRMYMFSNDPGRGEEFYREILAERPGDPDATFALAKLDIQRGHLAEAKEKLAALEAAGVEPGRLALERVLIQAAEGDVRGALDRLGRMRAERPDDVLPHAVAAVLAQDSGDAELFEKAVESLKRLPSKSLQLRLFLAQLMLERQDWAGARMELETLTRMNPANARVWEALVRADFAERKREQAEDHVRVLLTLEPENALGNLMLASFQRERGQLALAESSYRTALKSERRPATLNDLADLLLHKGRDGRHPGALAEARALLDEAVSSQPDYLTAYATRAELNLETGDLDGAEADIQKVVSAASDSPLSMFLSARLYSERGNFAAARDLADSIEARRDAMPPETLEEFRAFQAELKRTEPRE